MLAALQMQYLGTLTSTLKIKQALPKLSKRFEDYYQLSLDRIREKPFLQEQIFNLFAWLLYAQAPLGVDELRQCLCIDAELDTDTSLDDLDEHVERLVAESEGLVEILPLVVDDQHRGPDGHERGLNSSSLSVCPRPVSLAHQTIEAYLRDQRKGWASTGHDPQSLIFLSCARFLGLSACATKAVNHAAACVDTRSYVPLEPGFFSWCTRHWQDLFTEDLGSSKDADILLQTIADQLIQAGRTAGIDPLFACVLYRWYVLDGLLIARGANTLATYNRLTTAMAEWACITRSFGSFSRYHEYAWRMSCKCASPFVPRLYATQQNRAYEARIS